MRQAVGRTDEQYHANDEMLFEPAIARHTTRVVGIASPTRDHLGNLAPHDIPPVGEPS